MANIYTTNTPRFRPFSFQEMLQPYQIYTDAYNKTEEELANLDVMAGDVASKLSSTDDAELAQKATAFQEDLNKTMNELYNKGLNPTTKKQLAKLKARYTNEMNPINEAYKAYQTDQQYLAKMAVEHPEILIEGAGRSVSDYMHGKAPQMRSVNTDDLMNEALNLAKTQAGRTYRESGWTPTAGGRFLERTTEIGLNDVDFNNALALTKNPKLTAQDLGISEQEFNKIKNNASLISASINDVINTPSFLGLSEENQRKALNAVYKGVRAGFQYDKKVNTQSDPMFAYNLKAQEEANKKKQKAERIGSDLFITPDTRRNELKNLLTHTLGSNVGELRKNFEQYFKDGKLLSKEEIQAIADNMKEEGIGMPYVNQFGYTTPYSTHQDYGRQTFLSNYNALKDAYIDLGLDPNEVDKDTLLKTLYSSDATARERARIISDDKGFDVIQNYIEAGLLNTKDIQEVVGFGEAEGLNTNRVYKTKAGTHYKDLLDDKGNLDIISVHMDYGTGQRSFKVKTKDGIREFLMPAGASYDANDAKQLNEHATMLNALNNGYALSYKNGEVTQVPVRQGVMYDWPDGFRGTVEDYKLYIKRNMDVMFGDSFNYFGAQNTGN